ncbi:reticulophagy regulator 3-like [Littorina saxatilis]|uniref:RETREG1-3/ARL6IP-like N-terminal reticulon-homology domain-containing protein n=1 Tax=Littorina saxatilis TaxID=31220 RepID=A0AAN9BRX4_9CAEN
MEGPKDLWVSPKTMEGKLTELLNPVEPLIMRLQSLLVWEYPRRSAVFLVIVHVLFWIVAKCCVQIYSVISVALMVIFFIDTWKKRIWPEIRVPPPDPEDTDGWTPVHPRLLSVPEISHHLSNATCYAVRMASAARMLRREKPAIFFLLFSTVFLCMAALGMYMSGFLIIYTIVMSIMVWPSLVYHNLLKRAYLRMEPAFMWLDYQLKSKCRFRSGGEDQNGNQTGLTTAQVSVSGGPVGRDGRSGMLAQVVEEVEEEDFEPSLDPVTTAALARAITDSEDEGTGGTPSIPTLSKEPSIDNSDDERHTEDFSLDVDAMPSFDDLDHSDDDLLSFTPASAARPKGLPGLDGSDMPFEPSHFEDSDSDDESGLSKDLSFPDMAAQTVLSSGTDAATAALTSTLVTRTLTSMMETALQGVMGMASGQQAQSSGRLPHTGTKITYTKTPEGESIDFATPEPTITEDEEGCEPSDDDENENVLDDTINNEVAEIEKDFDFLDDLEGEGGEPATTPQ